MNPTQLDSSETELRIKRYDQKKFKNEYEQISKFKIFQKVDVIGSLDRWDQDETLDVGFI
jgi:hypothetical protein